MYFDSFTDFLPLLFICLTIWMMRARFTSRIDTPWPMLYYFLLVLFIRANEGNFNNYWIFAGIVCALFMRFEFMAGLILKAFRTGEFVVHMYVLAGCYLMLTKP